MNNKIINDINSYLGENNENTLNESLTVTNIDLRNIAKSYNDLENAYTKFYNISGQLKINKFLVLNSLANKLNTLLIDFKDTVRELDKNLSNLKD